MRKLGNTLSDTHKLGNTLGDTRKLCNDLYKHTWINIFGSDPLNDSLLPPPPHPLPHFTTLKNDQKTSNALQNVWRRFIFN